MSSKTHTSNMSEQQEQLMEDSYVEFCGDTHHPGDRSIRLSVYDMYTKARRDVIVGGAISLLIVGLIVYAVDFQCDCDENVYETLAWSMAWAQMYVQLFLYVVYRSVRSEIKLAGLYAIDLEADCK